MTSLSCISVIGCGAYARVALVQPVVAADADGATESAAEAYVLKKMDRKSLQERGAVGGVNEGNGKKRKERSSRDVGTELFGTSGVVGGVTERLTRRRRACMRCRATLRATSRERRRRRCTSRSSASAI